MTEARAEIWEGAPQLAVPEMPALFTDSRDLWVAYEAFSQGSESDQVAIVQFPSVIDHRLSPVNDEGLGEHPYASAGLEWYTFHEIVGSPDASPWSSLGTRHWVLTFKDGTLDVLASEPRLAALLETTDPPTQALLGYLKEHQNGH